MPFQYVTVKMPTPYPSTEKEGAWTDRLNAVAKEGWRLITISEDVGKGFTSHYATFEREVS